MSPPCTIQRWLRNMPTAAHGNKTRAATNKPKLQWQLNRPAYGQRERRGLAAAARSRGGGATATGAQQARLQQPRLQRAAPCPAALPKGTLASQPRTLVLGPATAGWEARVTARATRAQRRSRGQHAQEHAEELQPPDLTLPEWRLH